MLRSFAQGLLRPVVNRPKQQQRGFISALCGPPKNPMSKAETLGLGFGWLFVIMLMPMWGLFSVPGWREAGKPKPEPEPEPEPAPAKAPAKKDKKA